MRTRTSDFRGTCVLGHEHQRYSEVQPEQVSSSSTTISVALPMKCLAKAVRFLSAINVSSLARALRISGGTTLVKAAAEVPGRSEYGKTWTRVKGSRSSIPLVAMKSRSLSLGKPVIRSQPIPASGICLRIAKTMSLTSLMRYGRFIAVSILFDADCTGMCIKRQTLELPAIVVTVSIATSDGSSEPRRMRQSGESAASAARSSGRRFPPEA